VLESIRVENFKIFEDASIELRPLTVLTGFNSGGKSTIVQALLLANSACKSVNVPLNGPYGLSLGEAFDVLNLNATESEIRFTLTTPQAEENIRLIVPNDRAVILTAETSSRDSKVDPPNFAIDSYLSAERLGPRDLLEVPASQEEIIDVGERGQFTAHVLAINERRRVSPELQHPRSASALTLGGQVEAWLSEVVGPVRVQATWLPGTNAAMIRFRNAPTTNEVVLEGPESGVPGEWTRPSNVGFGLSYALPVIVAGLTAKPGSVLLVENPEAHLHPAGQSKIGYFLTLVASSGVQTIIETHSEHVVNGIRLAVAKNHLIPVEQVIFHFLGEDSMSALSISRIGTMSDWPPGFFDQAEEDLAELSRLKWDV
jgi:predicted ATPase